MRFETKDYYAKYILPSIESDVHLFVQWKKALKYKIKIKDIYNTLQNTL